MLTFGQMYRLTPRRVRSAAQEVALMVFDYHLRLNATVPYVEIIYKAMSSKKNRIYRLVVRQYSDDEDRLEEPRAHARMDTWLHCSCDYFKFFLEYAIARHGSSAIIRSNGQPPVIRNPKLTPYLCKHLLAIMLINPKIDTQRIEQERDARKKARQKKTASLPLLLNPTPESIDKALTTKNDALDEEIAELLHKI